MTKPQRVLFRTGAIASLVTSGFHLVGHFSEPQAPPDENGRLLLEFGLFGLVLLRRLPSDAATMRVVTVFSALGK